ncbi:hypothetical protein C453_00540 [Haloferax elongans ATCC BAA-1513]|uniref:Uncharacterized protein n=1 Tax=Haloferax elongans ATCC BAA-1513 TaxID=1230453 RepID=M0I0K6_HALEO|nr:hypothetical protein [Haloferax elongans]ELZ89518.1 hypothetical protein C453_00540 [Haloferax elongans ATCC BAA-1513]
MVLVAVGCVEPVVVVAESFVFDTTSMGVVAESFVFDTTSVGILDESDGVGTELPGYRTGA